MAAIYEIHQDEDGRFRFYLIADSGGLLLRSKAYETKRACSNAIASARKNASAIGQFERKTSKDGKGYFILKAENQEPLGQSATYRSIESLHGAIEVVRKSAPLSPVNDLSASWH